MTLRLRNILLLILASVSAICFLFLVYQFTVSGQMTAESLRKFLPVTVLILFGTVSCIMIFISFRNTASSEIFFYYIFIFSLIFDLFRFTDLLFADLHIFSVYTMAPTRIVYYGRFLGALALFSAGLFTTGLEYQRMGITTLLIFILPAALTAVLPVDVTSTVPGGTLQIGRFHEIVIAMEILNLAAVLNFLIAGIKNESREYGFIAAGLLTVIAGRELLFFLGGWIDIAGFVMMLAGSLVFSLRIHRLYLWD